MVLNLNPKGLEMQITVLVVKTLKADQKENQEEQDNPNQKLPKKISRKKLKTLWQDYRAVVSRKVLKTEEIKEKTERNVEKESRWKPKWKKAS